MGNPRRCKCNNFAGKDGYCTPCREKVRGPQSSHITDGYGVCQPFDAMRDFMPTEFGAISDTFAVEKQAPAPVTGAIAAEKLKIIPRIKLPPKPPVNIGPRRPKLDIRRVR